MRPMRVVASFHIFIGLEHVYGHFTAHVAQLLRTYGHTDKFRISAFCSTYNGVECPTPNNFIDNFYSVVNNVQASNRNLT